MHAGQRLRSIGPWATGLGAGLVLGLWLTAVYVDLHANKTCGLLPSTLGMLVLTVAFLVVATLISVVVANRPAPDTRRAGRWLFLVSVSASVVFFAGIMIATRLVSPGCSLGR